jgi:hypothetical protein
LQLLESGAYGKEATRLAEGVIDLLRDGGFRTDHLHTCFVTLFTFATGQIESDQLTDLPPRTGSADVTASPPGRAATFAFGIEALIEGLKVMLQPNPPTTFRTRSTAGRLVTDQPRPMPPAASEAAPGSHH